MRVLHVLPISGRANDLFTDALALLVLTKAGGSAQIQVHIVQELFSLTAAEARVAARLCRGGASLKRIADEMGVSLNTVKTQLQAVYAKTGTQKQIDLMRLLLASQLTGT